MSNSSEIENFNDKIYKILIIGDENFQKILKKSYILSELKCQYELEQIVNENDALKRLNHNSYDLLLLQDNFSKYRTIRLASMAYAMSRPTIIICDNIFKKFYYFIWKYFSKFSKRFKISRKLIFFSLINSRKSKLVMYLLKNHLQYFESINEEISKSTNL